MTADGRADVLRHTLNADALAARLRAAASRVSYSALH